VTRSVLVLLVAAALAAPAAATQSNRGTISGTVTDPGGPVATADVEAKNPATGTVYPTTTDKAGRFSLSVPAGTYEVSVPPLGFRTARFARQDQVVEAGKTLSMDIRLLLGNLGVVGDDAAFVAIRNRNAGVKGRLPRTAGGRPDLSGMWSANVDPKPEPAALLPWAQAILKERQANLFRDIPSSACLPDDPTMATPLPYKIIQTPTLLVFLSEGEPHYRQVFLDGRDHPKDPDPTWMGHSVGRWDGDTLVVDSVGFNDKSWVTMNGLPHTDQMHVIERFRRADLARMTHDITIVDPGTFTKPVEWHAVWELAPREEIMESICTENNHYRENISDK
jgi:hypothetical protein